MKRQSTDTLRKGLSLRMIFAMAAYLLAVCISQVEGNSFHQLPAKFRNHYIYCLNYAIKTRFEENPRMDSKCPKIAWTLVNNSLSKHKHDTMLDFTTKLTHNFNIALQQMQDEKIDVKRILETYAVDLQKKSEEDLAYFIRQSQIEGDRFHEMPAMNYKNYLDHSLNHAIEVSLEEKPTMDVLIPKIARELVHQSLGKEDTMLIFVLKLSQYGSEEMTLFQKDQRDDVRRIMKIFMKTLMKMAADVVWEKWQKQLFGAGFDRLPAEFNRYYFVCFEDAINKRIEEKPTFDIKTKDVLWEMVNYSLGGCNKSMQDFIINLTNNVRKKMQEWPHNIYDDVQRIMQLYVKDLLIKAAADGAYFTWQSRIVGADFDLLPVNHQNYFADCCAYAMKVRIQEKPSMDLASLTTVGDTVMDSLYSAKSLQDFVMNLILNNREKMKELQDDRHDDVKRIMQVYLENLMKKAGADLAYYKWQSQAVRTSSIPLPPDYKNYYVGHLNHAIAVRKKERKAMDFESQMIVLDMVMRSLNEVEQNSVGNFIMKLASNYRNEIKLLKGNTYDDVKRIIAVYVQDVIRKAEAEVPNQNGKKPVQPADDLQNEQEQPTNPSLRPRKQIRKGKSRAQPLMRQ